MKRYDAEVDEILLTLGGSIPVCGLKEFEPGEPEHVRRIRGKVTGAIFTQALDMGTFRKLARVMIRTGQAEIVDGFFRLKAG